MGRGPGAAGLKVIGLLQHGKALSIPQLADEIYGDRHTHNQRSAVEKAVKRLEGRGIVESERGDQNSVRRSWRSGKPVRASVRFRVWRLSDEYLAEKRAPRNPPAVEEWLAERRLST